MEDAVAIGKKALGDFKSRWPDSFHEPLEKIVATMDVKNKHVLVGQERVYDQELIYARVIGLNASARAVIFYYVLRHKSAAYPPSMFNTDGGMKISTSKSTLKQKLQVVVSERNLPIPDVVI